MLDLLYHYTNTAGLEGIISNNNIRATHVAFLNDWTEFREAFTERYVRVLLDSLSACLPPNRPGVIDGVLSNRLQEILQIISGESVLDKEKSEAFVCSFTGASAEKTGEAAKLDDPGDRLSQWRGYTPGGQGFSLGFDKTRLKDCAEFDNTNAKATLQECIYREEDKNFLFKELGRKAALRFNELQQSDSPIPDWFMTSLPNPSEEYKRICSCFLKALSEATASYFTAAARIKHFGFREENEWRVILLATRGALSPAEKDGKRIERVKFRDGQFGRTPYIEIPFDLSLPERSPLRRIVVGPGPYQEEAVDFVELLLLNKKIEVLTPSSTEGVEVSKSPIPFRYA